MGAELQRQAPRRPAAAAAVAACRLSGAVHPPRMRMPPQPARLYEIDMQFEACTFKVFAATCSRRSFLQPGPCLQSIAPPLLERALAGGRPPVVPPSQPAYQDVLVRHLEGPDHPWCPSSRGWPVATSASLALSFVNFPSLLSCSAAIDLPKQVRCGAWPDHLKGAQARGGKDFVRPGLLLPPFPLQPPPAPVSTPCAAPHSCCWRRCCRWPPPRGAAWRARPPPPRRWMAPRRRVGTWTRATPLSAAPRSSTCPGARPSRSSCHACSRIARCGRVRHAPLAAGYSGRPVRSGIRQTSPHCPPPTPGIPP